MSYRDPLEAAHAKIAALEAALSAARAGPAREAVEAPPPPADGQSSIETERQLRLRIIELEREIATSKVSHEADLARARLELEREQMLAKVRGERDLALHAAELAELRADNHRLEEQLRELRGRRE